MEKLKEKIEKREAAAIAISTALRDVAKRLTFFDRNEVSALADRIRFCNDRTNQFIASDSINYTTGELYDSHGTFWSCGSKLCPSCLAKRSRESRKRLRQALDAQRPGKGERFLFVTLTIKNPKLRLLATREIVNRAWTLFRKRKLCVDLVRGGCKSEEFTLTTNGFHYHLHLLIKAKWFMFNEFRRVWTECVAIAFEEANLRLEVDTKDGLLIVNFKNLTDREKAIQEVCKYITKSDSWIKMQPENLAEVALVKRWNRMFELFGTFSGHAERETYVHTRPLSDGDQPAKTEYWRDAVQNEGPEKYSERLSEEIARCREARIRQILQKNPDCELFDGTGKKITLESLE